MADMFDADTLARLRAMPPRQAYDEVRSAVYRRGLVQSEDFLDAYEELVEEGVLTWEQIEEFDD
jgi:hypothetical protein